MRTKYHQNVIGNRATRKTAFGPDNFKNQNQVLSSTLSQNIYPDNNRDYLESNCDIAREDCLVQRIPKQQSTSSNSINRTPKSEIRQPGQLFEKSATRGTSSSNITNGAVSTMIMNRLANEKSQPRIVNLNALSSSSTYMDR